MTLQKLSAPVTDADFPFSRHDAHTAASHAAPF